MQIPKPEHLHPINPVEIWVNDICPHASDSSYLVKANKLLLASLMPADSAMRELPMCELLWDSHKHAWPCPYCNLYWVFVLMYITSGYNFIYPCK